MRTQYVIALILAVFFPFFASATSIPAGFAPGAVWLSKTSLTGGDTVQLYTVLYDSADSAVAGTVSFSVDGTSISSQPFDLAAGTTKIVSATWAAVAGTHSISASLDGVVNKDTGEALTLNAAQASPISVTVVAPPPPSPAVQAAASAMNAMQNGAPFVTQTADTAYNALEDLRKNAVTTLQGALKANASAARDPEVLGTSTENVAPTAPTSAGSVMNSVWTGALSGLLYVAQIPFLFYASLVLVLFIVYKLIRTMLEAGKHPYRR